MRDYEYEYCARTDYIRSVVEKSGAAGIVYGNSGGKDSALTGILCKAACDNTVGIIMPCGANRNYTTDTTDAMTVARQYGIETRIVDLSAVRTAELQAIEGKCDLKDNVCNNIAPRLRMTTLYAFAAAENRLVAGIADLTVTEIYEFLRWLKAPAFLLQKAPSAGLFDTQTDESEMGVTYKTIDNFLLNNRAGGKEMEIIESFHRRSLHKLRPISTFENP